METIKISVDVNIELSESTKSFLTDLFRGATKMVDEGAKSLVDEKPKAPAKAAKAKVEIPTETAPAELTAQAEPEQPKEVLITIEQIRQELMAKVKDNREVIAEKLNELGAQSVTKLETGKYAEFFNFLKGL